MLNLRLQFMKFVRISVILSLLMALSMNARAQNLQLIDSLKRKLGPSTGEARFKLLNAIAWEYRFAYPDSTIAFARQAYDLGKSLELDHDMATPLNYIAIGYN